MRARDPTQTLEGGASGKEVDRDWLFSRIKELFRS